MGRCWNLGEASNVVGSDIAENVNKEFTEYDINKGYRFGGRKDFLISRLKQWGTKKEPNINLCFRHKKKTL